MPTSESGRDDGPTRRSRRQVLAATGALGASVLAGCTGSGDGEPNAGDGDGNADTPTADGMGGDSSAMTTTGDAVSEDGMGTTSMDTPTSTPGETATPLAAGEQPTAVSDTAWRSVELSPVRRDETVTVDGFDGPVVLEAFAVWCPKCTQKQEELRGLDDSITKISINIDPNEDAAKVREHANDHGFDWRYVVAPDEMIRSLVNAFGTTVTNAPSTPVVVACPGGGSSFFAGRGNVGIPEIEATAGNC